MKWCSGDETVAVKECNGGGKTWTRVRLVTVYKARRGRLKED